MQVLAQQTCHVGASTQQFFSETTVFIDLPRYLLFGCLYHLFTPARQMASSMLLKRLEDEDNSDMTCLTAQSLNLRI